MTKMQRRYFAVVPAAGQSVRMGRAKLLLPLAGRPLIGHTIEAWRQSNVDRILIVVRPDDVALADAVRAVSEFKVQGSRLEVEEGGSRVEAVTPESPPVDMKASVQAALAHVQKRYSPRAEDAFLIAPADMPRLSAAIVDRLIAEHRAESSVLILAPSLGGKRGHPVLFSWKLADDVFALAA